MADEKFNLTAEIQVRLASSVKVEAAKLRKQFSQTIPIKIDIKKSAIANIGTATSALKGLNAQVIAINANTRILNNNLANLATSASGLGKNTTKLNQTAAATKKVADTTKQATDQVSEFGRVAGLALRRNAGFILATTGIYGLGRAITSSFGEAIRFEKELVKVAQVSNRSVASLQPLVNEITRLSTTLGVASADLIDISLILAQAGLSANETRQALDVLAKTTLAATFGDIRDTTEGAIALMSQFEISAKDLSKALGATNAVSAAFAVESEDIIAAVKRAGGVFAQTSAGVSSGLDAFNEFIAVFSAVRATTRESAESIATGLRTIFTRIQRPQTIQFLKELGIELTDFEGKFVGPFEAVERLSRGLNNIDRRGSTFAAVSEELGGFRQIGKTLALLASSEQRIEALRVAQQGQNSVNKDAEQAQISLANAITKTREEFTALIREIAQTSTFDTLIRSVLGLANGMIVLARTIKPVIPLLAVIGTLKGIGFGTRFFPAFKRGLGIKLAKGGKVIGGKGGIDDIPAMLTSGEFVINKKSARIIGEKNLEELNRVGFAKGGPVGFQTGGKVKPQLVPIENFIGSKVKEIPIEVTLVVRDVNGIPINTKTHRAGTGHELVGQIGGNQQSDLTNTGRRNPFNNLRFTQIQVSERQAVLDRQERRRAENREFNRRQELAHDLQLERRPSQFNLGRRAAAAREAERASVFASRAVQAGNVTIHPNQIARILQSDTNNRFGFRAGDAFGTGALTAQELLAQENGRFVGNSIASSEFRALRRRRSITNKSSVLRLLGFGREGFGAGGGPPVVPDQFSAFRGGGGGGGGNPPVVPPSSGGFARRFRRFNRLNRGGIIAAGAIGATTLLAQNDESGVFSTTAGGALTGGFAGSFLGGKIGAAAGPAGAAAGAAVGAVLGGVAGGIKSFLDAKLDAQIQEASKNMISSISEIETALEDFSKRGTSDNFKKLNESFNKSFASAIETGGLEAQKIDLTNFGGFGRSRQIATGRIARTQIAEERLAFGQIGANLVSNLASSGEGAEALVRTRLSRGSSFDRAIEDLSAGSVLALAAKHATKAEAEALGRAASSSDIIRRDGSIITREQQLESTARSIVRGGNARLRLEEEQKRNDLLKEAQQSLKEANNQTTLFIDKINNLSAVFDRVSSAGETFRRQNESILSRRSGGAGLVSRQRRNVFENFRGFTQQEINKEAQFINNALGNSRNSRDFAQSIVEVKNLESNLPRILNQLGAQVSLTGGDEGRTLLPRLIEQNFGGLPKILQEQLKAQINEQFFANDQASPDDIVQTLAAGGAQELSAKISQPVIAAGQKFVDAMNKNTAEFDEVLNTWVGLVQEANQAEDLRSAIILESLNQEKQILGRQRLSVADRTSVFTNQLSSLGRRAGISGQVNAIRLFDRENALNSERFAGVERTSLELAKLTQEQQNARRALELIASNTDRQVALQEDLNGLIDSRRAARQIFEDFQFGSPTERRDIERSITLARQQLDGALLSPTQLKQAREGQRLLSTLTGAVEGPDAVQRLDQRFIELLDRGESRRLFDIAGVNPGVGVGGLLNNQDEFFQRRFRQLQEANNERAAAAGGLAEIDRRDASQFLRNGQDRFNAVQEGLQQALANGGLFDRLNNTLTNFPAIPERVELVGNMTVQLNVNGAEALSNMLPQIQQLVQNQLNVELNKRLNPLTGETNT